MRGWDDPRMPTISGLRRRGFPAEGIRDFATDDRCRQGRQRSIEFGLLEYAVRKVLNRIAPRRFGVLDPLKLVIDNYPEGHVEQVDAVNNPEDPSAGTREVPFSRELWIERDDFAEDPPPKFFRLSPGREVRLRGAYFVTCTSVDKDAEGNVVASALHLRPGDARRRLARWPERRRRPSTGFRPRTRSPPRSGCTTTCSPARIREPRTTCLADSTRDREVVVGRSSSPRSPSRPSARRSSSSGWVTSARIPTRRPGAPVFNRTMTLKDTWAKVQARG